MADYYWVGGTSNWNSAANWSASSGGAGGAGIPGSADRGLFDSNSSGNCRLDLALTGQSIIVSGSYAGQLDGATDNLNHTVTNVDLVSATLITGTGTWTVNGNFFGGQFTIATGNKIILAGTSKLFGFPLTAQLYDLEITGSYTGNNGWGNLYRVNHLLTISGTWTNDSNSLYLYGDMEVTNTGSVVAGGGSITVFNTGTIDNEGTIGCNIFFECDGSTPSTPIKTGAGEFTGTVNFGGGGSGARVIRLASGTHKFKHLTLSQYYGTGTHELDLATNNPNIEITGDVSIESRWSWTKGTGTITIRSSANQSLDFRSQTIEDIIINKSGGTATVTNNGFTTDSFTMTAGTFDANDININVTGDFTGSSGVGTVVMGNGIWTIGGSITGGSGITYTPEASTVKMTGTSKTLFGSYTFRFKYFEISAGASVTTVACGNPVTGGTSTIYGAWTTGSDGGLLNVTIKNTGSLINSSSVILSGTFAVDSGGTLSGTAGITFISSSAYPITSWSSTANIPFPCTFNGLNNYENTSIVFSSDLVFTAAVTFTNKFGSTQTYSRSNYNLEFRGNVTVTKVTGDGGDVSWTKGTGTITFSGTSAQSINWAGLTIEDIIVNKSSQTVTVSTNNFTTDSITFTSGTFDVSTLTVTCSGAMSIAANFTVNASSGGKFIVGGNFSINGTSGNIVTWNGPDLTISGTAAASYASVTNSDASGGTEVTATNSTNNGGNTNWNFGAAVVTALKRFGTIFNKFVIRGAKQ